MMKSVVADVLDEAAAALAELRANHGMQAEITAAGATLATAFAAGGKAISCGNGGSMCDAMHFAEELSGRFRNDRPGLPAIAAGDPSYLTCAGNDFGFDQIFARFVQSHGRPGDVLVAISTSGTSANVLRAAEAARDVKMPVLALTGHPDAPLGRLADHHLCTPGGRYADRVQELHIKVIHILIEIVERSLYPDNYSD